MVLWDVVTGQRTHLGEHAGQVKSVAYSPDGKTLATASFDGTVRLWDLAVGKLRKSLKQREGAIAVAYSPDGKTLAVGTYREVTLWDPVASTILTTLKGHGKDQQVYCVAFSPDGKTLASGSGNSIDPGEVRIWEVASGRQRHLLQRHPDAVTSVAFSPDGKLLASASQDQVVRLWDPAAGKEVAQLRGHAHSVQSVAFFPDSKTLASGSRDGTVRLWGLASMQERERFQVEGQVWGIAVAPDGKTVASGAGWKHRADLWDVVAGPESFILQAFKESVYTLVVSPDNKTVISLGRDRQGNTFGGGDIKVWDTASGQQRPLPGAPSNVSSIALSPNGKILATGHWGLEEKTFKVWGEVQLWDLTLGKQLSAFRSVDFEIRSLAFSPDGKTLASGGAYSGKGRGVFLLDAATGKQHALLKGNPDGVSSLSFGPDNKTLASGSENTVTLWDYAAGKEIATLQGRDLALSCLAFSPDGKTLAVGGGRLVILDMLTGKEHLALKGHAGEIHSVAWTPDGRTLTSGGRDGTVRLWDPVSGQERAVFKQEIPSEVTAVAYSPNAKMLASAIGGHDRIGQPLPGQIKFWKASERQEDVKIQVEGLASDVAYSSDGKVFAAAIWEYPRAVPGGIRIWDAGTGQERISLWGHDQVGAFAFPPDGKTLASGGRGLKIENPGELLLWDLLTGKRRDLPWRKGQVVSLAFSPDGVTLASASIVYNAKGNPTPGGVTLWDVTSGQERLMLPGDAGAIESVAFSPDGKLLATGGFDQTVKLWEAATGHLRATLKGHQGPVYRAVFSPDGSSLASVSEDRTIRVWDLVSRKERFTLRVMVSSQGRWTLRPESLGVHAVAFSPDGKLLAGGCGSYNKRGDSLLGEIHLWEATTGKEVRLLPPLPAPVRSLTFSPDGKTLVLSYEAGVIKLMDLAVILKPSPVNPE